jgi:hypothetical protein
MYASGMETRARVSQFWKRIGAGQTSFVHLESPVK